MNMLNLEQIVPLSLIVNVDKTLHLVHLMFHCLMKWRTYAVESRFEVRRFHFKCSFQHSCDLKPCLVGLKFLVYEIWGNRKLLQITVK